MGQDEGGKGPARPMLQLMVVEDEAISALALKRLVARLGHAVCAMTATAEDAIRLAGETLPDIVLMDIRLAGQMDGITAAREIRARFGIGSIFMTANSDMATRTQAETAQPLGFMAKRTRRWRSGRRFRRRPKRWGRIRGTEVMAAG